MRQLVRSEIPRVSAAGRRPMWRRAGRWLAASCICIGVQLGGVRAQAPSIAPESTPLAAWIASRPHLPPDSLPSFLTEPERADGFRALLTSILDHDWPQALAQAASLQYQLVVLQEADQHFVAAFDAHGRDATVVINLDPQRDFVVGAPHMPFEPGTGEQAVLLLRDLGGRAAIVSGAHRCASRSFTLCDGRTEVCTGSSEGYRDSDVGHNVEALFQAAHVLLAQRWPSSIVISLHGMRDDTEGVRTSLIVSNGIRVSDPAEQTVATRLRVLLGQAITQAGTIVSCNLPADEIFRYRKLCGYTNVQGRHVNGIPDACRQSVDAGTGRFVHLEQDSSVLQPYAEAWDHIEQHAYHRAFLSGLAATLPAYPGLKR